jgi:hypothetical protein
MKRIRFLISSSISSSFADYLRRLSIIPHGDKGAMPQKLGVHPLYECDLANQLRFDPAAFFHFLCG